MMMIAIDDDAADATPPPDHNAGATAASDTLVQEAVERTFGAWVRGDIDGVIASVHEDCEYIVHLNEGTMPFVGSQKGHAAIRATLEGVMAVFEPLLLRGQPLTITADRARHNIDYTFRHRASGQMLQGRIRVEWRVRDGLVDRIEEWHDRDKLEAFIKLNGLLPPADAC